MFRVEDDHWWYVGLRELVFSYVNKYANEIENLRLLDAGCGTGAFLARCEGFRTSGFDFSEEALNYCRARGLQDVVKGSITDIPFEDGTFDIAVSFDVLCHESIKDDMDALRELRRVLVQGGTLMLNLPAYNFLMSTHDKAVHTKRRYTLRGLKKKISTAGFEVKKITYRNTFLFPLALLQRVFKKSRLGKSEVQSDLSPPSYLINKLLIRVLSFENGLIPHMDLPFGLSVFCVARKR
jgi:SAM-dependent methyltransferase